MDDSPSRAAASLAAIWLKPTAFRLWSGEPEASRGASLRRGSVTSDAADAKIVYCQTLG
jgi:hypothetical protein